MKKVFILTEGGKGIGFGHITRCTSIYQAFEESYINPKFIINGDDSIIDLVNNFNYSIFNWIDNFEELKDDLLDSDIILVDSYKANSEIYKEISNISKLSVYFDDFNRIEYPKGIIINGAIGAENLDYSNQTSKLLLGTNYTPLRKVFWEESKKEIKEEINSIMITFGGDDMRNLTPKVLKEISTNFPKLIKNIIIGKSFNNIQEIKNNSDENTILHFFPSPSELKKIMIESDIAISAGGQTLYELASVGTPAIIVSIADNQNNSINGFIEKNLFYYSGEYKDLILLKTLIEKINEMKNYYIRNIFYKNMTKNINSNGSKIIVKKILKIKNNER
ncbi:MAG: UDP-2,4-diacetamido-2,4,6-trideoxy-beta-L-altropyranose hydrolase [Candidatus Sericytochromatia bacterium]